MILRSSTPHDLYHMQHAIPTTSLSIFNCMLLITVSVMWFNRCHVQSSHANSCHVEAWRARRLSSSHRNYTLTNTSSSAIAEEPQDALSHSKSCQLLHNCTKNHIWLEGLPFHKVSHHLQVLWISSKACMSQTDGRRDRQNYDSQDRASIAASRGKNRFFY